jgi:hypothetical protein
MTIDIHAAIAEVKAKQNEFSEREKFWYSGQVPDAIKAANASIDAKVHIRIKRIIHAMEKANMLYYRPWLIQLMLHQKVKGGAVKTHVIMLKYALLDESMRRDLEWTNQLDDHAEALALKAYRDHKEKPRA